MNTVTYLMSTLVSVSLWVCGGVPFLPLNSFRTPCQNAKDDEVIATMLTSDLFSPPRVDMRAAPSARSHQPSNLLAKLSGVLCHEERPGHLVLLPEQRINHDNPTHQLLYDLQRSLWIHVSHEGPPSIPRRCRLGSACGAGCYNYVHVGIGDGWWGESAVLFSQLRTSKCSRWVLPSTPNCRCDITQWNDPNEGRCPKYHEWNHRTIKKLHQRRKFRNTIGSRKHGFALRHYDYP
ncbi:hypothetical protein FA13DRAFT_1724478 [Coprinellus micaceus]|uniref:Secreted protein n=1 Tax=Coprinellus micaceus TaxID=71717 RepID=A0A4Y7TWH0_COPMI|nr:hypothetical protein FA13DRAFT_1724478 [Coprinellus micaceus]